MSRAFSGLKAESGMEACWNLLRPRIDFCLCSVTIEMPQALMHIKSRAIPLKLTSLKDKGIIDWGLCPII